MRSVGNILIIAAGVIVLFIFGPVMKEELGYQFDRWGAVRYSLDVSPEFPETGIRPIVPVDKEFGIVIPKINVNASIYPEVDPADPEKFLPILRKGVAHAKGSSYPNKEGNVFLFAHSSDSFYNVGQYNAIFFLIGKLDKGDEIDLFYRNKRYKYKMTEKAVVSLEGLEQYVKEHTNGRTLTLQTGYPPGTTWKRLVVVARHGS